MGLKERATKFVTDQLQPYLRSNVSPILNVGVSEITLVLPNLEFDADALNRAGMESSPLLIKQDSSMKMESVQLSFTPFRQPVLSILVQGWHADLEPRSPDDDWWEKRGEKTAEQEKIAALDLLDPPGASAHTAAQGLAEEKAGNSLITQFITSLMLTSVTMEFRDTCLRLVSHAHSGSQHVCSIPLSSLEFGGSSHSKGSSWSAGLMGAVTTAVGGLWKKNKAPITKYCAIQGLGLLIETHGLEGDGHGSRSEDNGEEYADADLNDSSNQPPSSSIENGEHPYSETQEVSHKKRDSHVVLFNGVVLGIRFTDLAVDALEFEIPEAAVGLELQEMDSFGILSSQIQGHAQDAATRPDTRCLEVQGESNSVEAAYSGRNPKDLWKKGIQKAILLSSKGRIAHSFQAGMLRSRYSRVYESWLLELGWGKREDERTEKQRSKKKKDRLTKLSEEISQMQNKLSIEAIALGRRLARRRVSAARPANGNAIRDANSISEAARSRKIYSSFQEFLVSFWRIIVMATLLMQGQALAVPMWISAARRLGLSEWESVWSVVWRSGKNENVATLEDSEAAPDLESLSVTADTVSYADEKSEGIAPENYFQLSAPEEDSEITAFSSGKNRKGGMFYAFKIARGSITLAGRDIEAPHNAEDTLSRLKGGEPVPASTLIPAMRFSWLEMVLAYGSSATSSGASVSCKNLDAELSSVIPSQLSQKLSANLDAKLFEEKYLSFGRWYCNKGDRALLLSSSPCPQKKVNTGSHTIGEHPLAGEIYDKHWIWQERHMESWSKSWQKSRAVEGMSSSQSTNPRLDEYERPFLIAEYHFLDDEPGTSAYPGGLTQYGLSLGRLDLDLKGVYFTSICQLLDQLNRSEVPTEEMQTDSTSKPQSQDGPVVSLEKFWDDSYRKYVDTCRDNMAANIPKKSMFFTAVVDCPRIRLSATASELHEYNPENTDSSKSMLKLDFNVGATVIFDLGRIESAMWPPKIRKEALVEKPLHDIGREAIAPNDLWNKAVDSKLWLKKPPASVHRDFVQRRDWEHEQVGSNIYICIEAVALTLELQRETVEKLPILGPLALVMETSLCWDEYSSLLRTSNSVSAAVLGKILSLSLQAYVAEVTIVLQVFGFYAELMKSNPGSDNNVVEGGESFTDVNASSGEERSVLSDSSKDSDLKPNSLLSGEAPFTACALTFSVELENFTLVLGDSRQEDGLSSLSTGVVSKDLSRGEKSRPEADDAHDWKRNRASIVLGREVFVLVQNASFAVALGDEENFCILMEMRHTLMRLVNSGKVDNKSDLAKLRTDFFSSSMSNRRLNGQSSGYRASPRLVLADVALDYFRVKAFGASAHERPADEPVIISDSTVNKQDLTDGFPNGGNDSDAVDGRQQSSDSAEPNVVDLVQTAYVDPSSVAVTLDSESVEQLVTEVQDSEEHPSVQFEEASSSNQAQGEIYWLAADLEISKILVTEGPVDVLLAKVELVANGPESSHLNFGFERGLQRVVVEVEGGLVLLHSAAVGNLMQFSTDMGNLASTPASLSTDASEAPQAASSGSGNIEFEDTREASLETIYRSASTPAISTENRITRHKRTVSAPPTAEMPVTEKPEQLPGFDGVVFAKFTGFSLVLAKQNRADSDGILFELEMSTMVEVGKSAKKASFDLIRFTVLGLQARSPVNLGMAPDRTNSRIPQFGASFKLGYGNAIESQSGQPHSSPIQGSTIPEDVPGTNIDGQEGPSEEIGRQLSDQSLPDGKPISKEDQMVAGNDGPQEPASVSEQAEGFKKSLSSFNSFILERLSVHVDVENVSGQDKVWKWSNAWRGQCYVGGFDVAITTAEIQLLQTLVAPLSSSGASSKPAAGEGVARPAIEEEEEEGEEKEAKEVTDETDFEIPDGAIIAIKDVNEHCYLAVEEIPTNKGQYRLAGVLHYTLAGDRALFKLKYQEAYTKSSNKDTWFSLLSLHAKDPDGQPFCVHYRTGSGLVDISVSRGGSWERWKFVPANASEDGNSGEVDIQNPTYKNLFHLLNQKGKCGIAFEEDVPIVVNQPGNPFKVKVFAKPPDWSSESHGDMAKTKEASFPELTLGDQQAVDLVNSIPCVTCSFDTVIFTVLHEAAGGLHLLPLVRVLMPGTEGVVHMGLSKMRTIFQCGIVLEHFESQSSRWVSIVNPIETDVFYRARSTSPGIAAMNKTKCPVAFFSRFSKVDIVLSEPSLDALLFLVGALDLAGPFSLRYSPVQANRCLVRNHTGVDALCSFEEGSSKGGEMIPSWHSDSFLMRHMTSRRETGPAKVASTIALYLQKVGTGVTTPILVTLGDPGAFAIRTRLETEAGKVTTGPIVVVDVARRTEDGIFVVISPMVRIRNATGLPLELKCRRDSEGEEGAVVVLEDGDAIDDSMGAFDALNLSGDIRKALMSLNLGNYILSVRPAPDNDNDAQFDWSEDVKGAKISMQSSGLLEKFHFNFNNNNNVQARNLKSTFGVIFCDVLQQNSSKKSARPDQSAGFHFLIRTAFRQVSLSRPKTEAERNQQQGHYTTVAWHQQQEILLLPTVRVMNLTTSSISVLFVSSSELRKMRQGRQGKSSRPDVDVLSFATAPMYVDLGDIFLVVKQKDLNLSSKPIDLGLDSKELSKNSKGKTRDIEIELDFGDGVHCALATVRRGEDGVLEVALLTKYSLQNDSHVSLRYCSAKHHSSWWGGLRRAKTQVLEWPKEGTGLTIAPKSKVSWFERSTTVLFKRTDELAELAVLDLESVSGSMEISLRVHRPDSVDDSVQLGVQLKVPSAGDSNPSCIILLVPRYVVANDSKETILICQDGFQDTSETISLEPGESSALNAQELPGGNDRQESEHDEAGPGILLRVRFRPKEPGWNWSGPVNAAAIGSFSVKIRRSQQEESTGGLVASQKPEPEDPRLWFAVLDVQERESSLVMSFQRQPVDRIPYRIENALRSASITYSQEGLDASEFLESGQSVGYVWDDLSEPHTLVVNLASTALREQINPDKLRSWKSFRASRKMGILQLPFLNDLSRLAQYGDGTDDDDDGTTSKAVLPQIGYEVYADGPTRVVRVCEEKDGRVEGNWQSEVSRPDMEVEMRISLFTISIVEPGKQPAEAEREEGAEAETVTYVPIISLRLTNVLSQARHTPEYAFCQLKTAGLDVDVKWEGAPVAAMLRGHGQDRFDTGHTMLHMAVVVSNTAKNPIQLKYASVLLQAIDVNLDEETMMKLVPFYRVSLSESTAPSSQIYFERFEIHPIKIVGSFLPGNPRADYSSGQETLRALLHSVIRVPTVRGAAVELNGVLLSNALLTFKQLSLKCAQHYSWYAMRGVYIARGSKLLPAGFASLFDDSANSSLDVFFDPSSGSIDLQGLTLGMFGMLKRGLSRKRKGGGTQRYLGDFQHTVQAAGSNILFAAVTEVSDSVLKGADAHGLDGFFSGFRRGILNVAMKPSVLRGAVVHGGSTRRIHLDRIVGANEAYIEGYLQAALDALFKQSYVRVKVIDDQVILKNLPPNTTLMEEMVQCVKDFLIGEGLLAGESSAAALSSLRRLQGENERKVGPTVVALCQQLLVIIVVRSLRRQTVRLLRQNNITFIGNDPQPEIQEASTSDKEHAGEKPKEEPRHGFFEGINFKRALTGFALSSVLAYIDGRICRHIPNPLVRRIVSGFLLSFVE